jgi:hypothetical protein
VLALLVVAGLYSVLAYHHHPGGLPLAPVAVFLVDTLWPLTFILLPLTILFFPEGELPSRRWRFGLWAYLALSAVVMAGISATEVEIMRDPIRVDPTTGMSIGTPTVHGPGALFVSAGNVVVFALPLFWLLSIARPLYAWRRASGEHRQQLKWLMSGLRSRSPPAPRTSWRTPCSREAPSTSSGTSPISASSPYPCAWPSRC